MVMNGTNAVVNELLSLLAMKRKERQELNQRLAEYDVDIQALERTVRIYSNGKAPVGSEPVKVTADFLRGMNQLTALKTIARNNNGLVRPTDAKKLLIEAKLITGDPKNAGPHRNVPILIVKVGR